MSAMSSQPGHASRHPVSGRAKALAIGVAVAVALVAAIWVVAVSRTDAKKSTGAADSMAAMEGMAGMNLTEGGSVRLTSTQLREFGITFGTVEVRQLTSDMRTAGVVTFDETKIAQVVPKFGGFVERLHVDFTGEPVRRGQPLLDVYSPELLTAQQELLLVGDLQRDIGRSAVPGVPEGSTSLVESAKRRLRLLDISEAQIEEILHTGRPRRTLTLYAPTSGVVIEKKVVRGQAIMPGEPLYTIADLSRVWIDIQLPEADAASVRVGSAADLEFAGLPGRTFKGRVEYVYPTLEAEARTIRARIAVTNRGGALKPGMYATARLTTPGRSALSVPSSAVLRTGDRNVVFVDMGGGELMPHDVELGRTAGEFVEVLAGLEPGQRVVTSAQFLLDSESNLGEVMGSMMGQMGSSDMNKMERMKVTPAPSTPGMTDRGAEVKNMPGMKTPRPSNPR